MNTSPTESDIALCDASYPNCVITPALVDSHVHFPQTKVKGSASGPFYLGLTILFFQRKHVFDSSYARQVASDFCDELIKAGTGAACIYSSPHLESTQNFEVLAERGLKAMAGLTLMDQSAPPENLT